MMKPIVNKEIQVFYTMDAPSGEYLKLRYDLVTTIIYAPIYINGDGSLKIPNSYSPDNLISYAHNRDVKVVLLFGVFDDNVANNLLANPNARTTAINNLLNEVRTHNFDGVDNDIEKGTRINPITNTPNKELMTAFQTELSDTFWKDNPDYRISIDLPVTIIWQNMWDVAMLQNKVDYMMLMGYGYYARSSLWSGPNAPINNWGWSISNSLNMYSDLINDKKKLLLGVPYYGIEWPTVNDEMYANTTGVGVKFEYDKKIDIIESTPEYKKKWGDIWKTPWYVRQENSQLYQGYYDNIRSLGIKYDLVKSLDIGGIGIWAIEFGTDRDELWQLIKDKFTECMSLSVALNI